MAYELHIERDKKISMEQWRAALDAVPGVKEDITPLVAHNPKTGRSIEMPGEPGNGALELNGEWIQVFRLRRGRASFNGRTIEDMEDASDPVRAAAVALAKHLDARIVGDEGEVYDWLG